MRFAHHDDVDRLADVDAAQLGFLEVAVDAERIAVDDRQHRAAGRHVFADARCAVVQVAVYGTDDRRALEVQLRGVERHLRIGDGGFTLFDARAAFLDLFARDQVTELQVARVFAFRLGERRAALGERGFGEAFRKRVAGLVDHEQHLAALDLLVVGDLHRRDEARHVRRDLDHVGAHVTVAGPRREHVVVDDAPQHDGGHDDHDQGKQDLPCREPGFFHG